MKLDKGMADEVERCIRIDAPQVITLPVVDSAGGQTAYVVYLAVAPDIRFSDERAADGLRLIAGMLELKS